MPEIRQNLTTVNRTKGNNGRKWIVVHNVGTAPTYEGAAYANTQYFASGYHGASAHYFVDEGPTIWQCVDESDTAWSVGDGASRNGCCNSNSINVEVCGDWSFDGNRAENLRWLVSALMEKYGIDADHVIRHYDVTGKSCPACYVDQSRWAALKEYITEGEDVMASLDEIGQAVWEWSYSGQPTPFYQLYYNTVPYIKQLLAEVAALTAAVEALAGASGADPDAVAKAVADAVERKLESLKITVDGE